MISTLVGQHITHISVDWMLRLRTDGLWEIGTEGAAELRTPDVDGLRLKPRGEEAPVPPAYEALVGRRIDSLSSTRSGDLTIVLDDARLTLFASPDYESWALGGPRGESVICLPGGELAEWGARP